MDWIVAGTVVYDCVLLGSSAFIIRYGGLEERIAILICWIAGGLTGLLAPVRGTLGEATRFVFITIDVATLIAFDIIMVRSWKFWPMWATGIQAAAVILGLALLMEPATLGQYRLIQGKFAYGVLLTILVGAWRTRQLGMS